MAPGYSPVFVESVLEPILLRWGNRNNFGLKILELGWSFMAPMTQPVQIRFRRNKNGCSKTS